MASAASAHFLMASDRTAADKHLRQCEQGEEIIVWEIPPQPKEVPGDVLNLRWEAEALAKYLWGVADVMLYENADMIEEAGVHFQHFLIDYCKNLSKLQKRVQLCISILCE